MDDTDARRARIAGRTLSSNYGRVTIDWSRPIYGYAALAVAALVVAGLGISCIG